MAPQLKFLYLEPFFGGPHREFTQGWVAHSRHCIDLLTLPARFWKWRMRGAALHAKLSMLLNHYQRFEALRADLSAAMGRFAWECCIDRFDAVLEKMGLSAREFA